MVTSCCVYRAKETCTYSKDLSKFPPVVGATLRLLGMPSHGDPTGLSWWQGLAFMGSPPVKVTFSLGTSTCWWTPLVMNMKLKYRVQKLMNRVRLRLLCSKVRWLRCKQAQTSLYKWGCTEQTITSESEGTTVTMETLTSHSTTKIKTFLK